jgi:hypothetical protein
LFCPRLTGKSDYTSLVVVTQFNVKSQTGYPLDWGQKCVVCRRYLGVASVEQSDSNRPMSIKTAQQNWIDLEASFVC